MNVSRIITKKKQLIKNVNNQRFISKERWKNPKSHREYLEQLKTKLNFKDIDDWYSVSLIDFRKHGGYGLLKGYYNYSPVLAIIRNYPEHEWQPWKFERVPVDHWDDRNNVRIYLTHLAKIYGYKKKDDWYNIDSESFKKHNGGGLLKKYHFSPYKIISFAFPEYTWLPWKFNVIPHDENSIDNHMKFMDYLGMKLNYLRFDDWHSLQLTDLRNNDGSMMLSKYPSSISVVVSDIYNSYRWSPWLFSITPKNTCSDVNNVLRFMDDFGRRSSISSFQEFYNCTVLQLLETEGFPGILSKYSNSPSNIFGELYPQYQWSLWKFLYRPKKTWNDCNEIDSFLEHLGRKNRIRCAQEWYRISYQQSLDSGGPSFSISKILKESLPGFKWDQKKFSTKGGKKSSQRLLYIVVSEMFPKLVVQEDYRHYGMLWPGSGLPMELDIFVPSLSLAFEYQGFHHYTDSVIFGPSAMYKGRDKIKREECSKFGISLVDVPYWWDGTKSSLIQFIKSSLSQTEFDRTQESIN
eukprot:TRINITY_DN3159_c0_g2_i2.p1 TRINITY_DN3159_c0_g2~~TRINITY_DN3159_c0_g2_i2.p1  ORF type:complete len:521 (+),score=86.79 TRINITY_DN3159_c0_g2_i2:779-2341(+)